MDFLACPTYERFIEANWGGFSPDDFIDYSVGQESLGILDPDEFILAMCFLNAMQEAGDL